MGLKVGIVGVGAFAQGFIPLFRAHPLVDEGTLCDLDAEKLRQNGERHGIPRTRPRWTTCAAQTWTPLS